MRWLIDGGYLYWLNVHSGTVLLLTAYGAVRFWRGITARRNVLALSLLTLALGIWYSGLAPARPAVFYDEFFYAATARNMAASGHAEPLCYRGWPPQTVSVGFPKPPYPVGWPYLVSLDWRWHKLLDAEAADAVPVWERGAEVNRILYVLMPLLLFWGLCLDYPPALAWLGALLFAAVPAVQRLGHCGSSEGSALFALLLAFWAWRVWHKWGGVTAGIWCITCAVWIAEMRTDGMIWTLLFLGAMLLEIWRHKSERLSWKPVMAGGLLVLVWLMPPVAISVCHPADSAHHFQAIPRADLTMAANRLYNVGNNFIGMWDNKIWPLPLTILAMWGLFGRSRREAGLWLALGTCITLLFSWFPFGDFDCVYSWDTWRFTYHLLLPAVVLSLLGLSGIWQRRCKAEMVAVSLPLLMMLANFLVPNAFLVAPHPLQRVFDYSSELKGCIGDSPVVAETEEMAYLLRYGCALPAVWGPVQTWPAEGAAVVKSEANQPVIIPKPGEKWQLVSADLKLDPHIRVYFVTAAAEGLPR
ncbi:hypothetical protein IJT17_03270 [bacterium]|nr:hypothetical protein [bacterium]